MEKFYEELKTLRERQDIELTEIQNRTKINLEILEAFERGEFDALPLPYIRLFLRAYVIEIGGDPDEALTQLEHYLSNKNIRKKPNRSFADIFAGYSQSGSKFPVQKIAPGEALQSDQGRGSDPGLGFCSDYHS